MSSGRNPLSLVTGASGGIGEELARILARHGYDLVLVARSADKLAALAERLELDHGIQVRAVAKDLARPDAAAEIHEWLAAEGLTVDVLVNNAGMGLLGKFAEIGIEGDVEMLRLNVEAPTLLTRLLLPSMLERGSGRILSLASTAGFQPGPLMAVYYATKAYVLSFSEALANEVAGTGVTVTALCPGPTETGFSSRAGSEQSRLFKGPTMDARTAAEAGYAALMAGKPVVVPGFRNRILAFGVRLAPRRVVTQIARRMNES
ncbi:MAG: short-chain dehydrogenase/reductase [Actinobacteria bacterium]|nr:short-chain dehydrogenase/reductase [Actinomycetota bacterium]